jgi:hypothetical protein
MRVKMNTIALLLPLLLVVMTTAPTLAYEYGVTAFKTKE